MKACLATVALVLMMAGCSGTGASTDASVPDAAADPRCHATAEECTACGAPPAAAQHFCPAGPFQLNAAWCFYDRCYQCSGGQWGEIYTDCQLARPDGGTDAQP